MRINGYPNDLGPHGKELIVLCLELRQLVASGSGEIEKIKNENHGLAVLKQVRHAESTPSVNWQDDVFELVSHTHHVTKSLAGDNG